MTQSEKGKSVTCLLCGKKWPADENGRESFFYHMRSMHPEFDTELERWPDGELVIVDTTLEPSDFNDKE